MKRLGSGALIFWAVGLWAGAALAGEHGAEHDGWGTLVAHAVNLALLIGAIVYFAKRPMKKAMEARAAEVGKDIAEASRVHDEAAAMLADYEGRLSRLDAEAQALLLSYREEGEADKARLIAEGEAEAERIRQEAIRSAAHELQRARERLEAEVVDMAIEAARETIAEKITPADDRRLTADYLSRLEQASGRA